MGNSEGPRAPRDPAAKRRGFYIMRGKQIAGSPQPDGRGIQYIYLDGERLVSFARIAGNITEEGILGLLRRAEGFRRLVHSIGVTIEMTEGESGTAEFVFQMYGRKEDGASGTEIKEDIPADGMERILELDKYEWSEADDVPGQMRFVLPQAGSLALASVKLYLRDGYSVPEEAEEETVDLGTAAYREMLERSLMQTGNPARLQKAIGRARQGEDVTVAFIGGSITQGAGAVPIHTECYAYKTFENFCSLAGRGTEENIHYVKAGVGGTPSELGMLRYERDVLRDGTVEPDVAVVEFAVNDGGDETGGECYDSLVRKILSAPNAPAVILLFAVFADDWNLQERLRPVGEAYDLPMVSIRDAVVEQFGKKAGTGKVFSKAAFFYDCYHPSNLGHRVMADCVAHLLRTVDAMPTAEDCLRLEERKPPLGGEFEAVKLFDRNSGEGDIQVDCGSFFHRDEELQAVEMDRDLIPTKEFPYNWMHRAGEKAFSMDITCSALFLIYKDSGSSDVGRAEVLVDGEKVLTADPHINGWIHCNAAICFRGRERGRHHVEIHMVPGEEEKEFTILGFGYVR
ncbi:MAG: SGNH/GDSL hydrolase family protein [Lachnospiraceae bacterium]|uniref:SGNH/GDSL hydrolase family protein n=1 Tax=uncultured Acetatifactor sp. TaxID=1671927 RepID=UPI0026F392F8|nr:SGNH/GDSL hydrolase family protein [uncultured Acetatifactor sp.]MCI8790522.1 SGNH/GDSL hydrolase family protein [Lachnospiraceae bacterium]